MICLKLEDLTSTGYCVPQLHRWFVRYFPNGGGLRDVLQAVPAFEPGWSVWLRLYFLHPERAQQFAQDCEKRARAYAAQHGGEQAFLAAELTSTALARMAEDESERLQAAFDVAYYAAETADLVRQRKQERKLQIAYLS